jgi:hypothetical protein
MDSGMRKWAASQGYSWGRKMMVLVLMLMAVMTMGPGLSNAMHVQFSHAGSAEVMSPMWTTASSSGHCTASRVLLAQALSSTDDQNFRSRSG